jgi:hypothetical protein
MSLEDTWYARLAGCAYFMSLSVREPVHIVIWISPAPGRERRTSAYVDY